ncbi:MAG: hypothetical protein H7A25_08355 [Leptospiraceae bacterium]|nr:hypothetical protein [Leptospiraceae bacterium]
MKYIILFVLSILYLHCYPKAKLDHFADESRGFIFQLISTINTVKTTNIASIVPKIKLSGNSPSLQEGQFQIVSISLTEPIQQTTIVKIESNHPSLVINGNASTELTFISDNYNIEQKFTIQAVADENTTSETVTIDLSADKVQPNSFSVSILDTTKPEPKLYVSINDVPIYSGNTYDFYAKPYNSVNQATITLENKGEGILELISDPPFLMINGENKEQFTISQPNLVYLKYGEKTNVGVQFVPGMFASGKFDLLIPNNDPSNNAYSITIQGSMNNGFYTTDQLNFSRTYHTTSIVNGSNLLVIGGISSNSLTCSNKMFLYNSQTASFSELSTKLSKGRCNHTSTVLNDGKIIIAGGSEDSNGYNDGLDSVEIFDSIADTIYTGSKLNEARHSHKAILLDNGNLIVFGGKNDSEILRSVEIYNQVLEAFDSLGDMNFSRYNHTATLLKDGKVLITGGNTETAELFDLSSNVFTLTDSMSTKRCNHTATLLKDGKVLIAGGDDCSYSAIKLNTAEIYDPQTGLFTHVSDMKVVRSDHTASLLKDGRVLIVGGTRYYDNEKTTEIYDPQTGTFTPGPPTINKHANHTADMLPDGKVIIIGNGTEIYIP